MPRSLTSLAQSVVTKQGFCTNLEKIVASVLFERLPVVTPKIDPVVYRFHEFSGKGDYHIEYEPAPRITEADKTDDRMLIQIALDMRLYLLLYGNAYGSPSRKHAWHFPEKVYESEETLRKCPESALQSVLGDLSHAYFVGNAPVGHMVMQPTVNAEDSGYKVIETNKCKIGKREDFVWVTKDEQLEYFLEQAEYLNKMIIR